MAGLCCFSRASSEGDGVSVIVHGPEPGVGEDGDLPDLRARSLGLDSVIEVRAEEPEQVRELVELELFVLTGEEPASALEPLPDRPAGKRALAVCRGATTDRLAELARAGSDAVLVGDAPPAA